MLRRYGATLIASRRVELAGTTIIRARLAEGRDLRAVLTQMASDNAIAGAQPNFTFELQQDLAQPVSTTATSTRSDVPTLRLSDPAADMAVAAALVSALSERPLGSGTIVFGELALSGELRPVAHSGLRLREAAKLGFEKALVPASVTAKASGDNGGMRLSSYARLANLVDQLLGRN